MGDHMTIYLHCSDQSQLVTVCYIPI